MTEEPGAPVEQLALLREQVRRARPTKAQIAETVAAAAELPVARVAVDVSLPHLDRPFDYLVPATMDAEAVPGVRVRVRFAGQLVDGYLLERVAESAHAGTLAKLQKVVSPEPVLTPEVANLAREVANRWSGTLADVLRLAIPPRHARVEAEAQPESVAAPAPDQAWAKVWEHHEPGPGYVTTLLEGGNPRAVWSALPGADWADPIAAAVAACRASGRGALIVVPDARDLARMTTALDRLLGTGSYAAITADLGPAERYRRWLAVRRGQAQIVVGTRAAAFAPVQNLGLVVCWDDGDDSLAEPRAPYPHVREVLCMRAHFVGAGALIGGYVVTAEGAALISTRWARMLKPSRAAVRERAPVVQIAGSDTDVARDPAATAARLPSFAWQPARAALEHGPVLVQVPRRGYLPVLACVQCRTPARCSLCHGPLGLDSAHGKASCRWCDRPAVQWGCPECAAETFRAVVVGAERTLEELGRAFPGTVIRAAEPGGPVQIPGGSALVVATPGVEPVAAGGYAAALLLDGGALLNRADLRAGEETLRRWLHAAALVRPGAPVVLMAQSQARPAQALVRWDPFGFATEEMNERASASLPPAVRLAALTGPADAVHELLALAELPPQTAVLGPVTVPGDAASPATGSVRALLRVPRPQGVGLAAALSAAAGVRSAKRMTGSVRIQIDPIEIG
ncbi:MAG: primosomal protein N' [Sporichthyaceae bacterium]